MDTLTKCLEEKVIIDGPLREYEALLLGFIFSPKDIPNIQDKLFKNEEVVFQMHYNLTLKSFADWLDMSKDLHTQGMTKFNKDNKASFDLFLQWKHLEHLEREIFKLFVGNEYDAVVQLRKSYTIQEFPAFNFEWEHSDGSVKVYTSVKSFFTHMEKKYKSRGWKLSNFI